MSVSFDSLRKRCYGSIVTSVHTKIPNTFFCTVSFLNTLHTGATIFFTVKAARYQLCLRILQAPALETARTGYQLLHFVNVKPSLNCRLFNDLCLQAVVYVTSICYNSRIRKLEQLFQFSKAGCSFQLFEIGLNWVLCYRISIRDFIRETQMIILLKIIQV